MLLLPRGRLPLNIFEPRYLAMIRDALAAPHRMIGMIQPKEDQHGAGVIPGEPDVCHVGCAGRIVSFAETGDGRYLIELKGVARFAIASEPTGDKLYRAAVADWSRYRGDLDEAPQFIDRDKLIAALKPYFHQLGINPDWRALDATDGRSAGHHGGDAGAVRAAGKTGAARSRRHQGARRNADRPHGNGGARQCRPADAARIKETAPMADIDPKLLEILVCPLTKAGSAL